MRRRLMILVGLVALVIWLIRAEPQESNGSLGAPWFYSRVLAQSCCTGSDTNPHMGCVDGACALVYDCGVDDCSACPGCDPNQEWQCINNGGVWDSGTCTCENACDPDGSQQQACEWNGGTWNSFSCYCDYPYCYVDETTESYDCSYCDEWSGDYYDCTCYDHCFTEYCDGIPVDYWCEYGESSCVVFPGSCGS
jgi:hypothetical protein